jgi:glyoxylase-like metal-dependent hydrolase (beta-lactamase superfamily II)
MSDRVIRLVSTVSLLALAAACTRLSPEQQLVRDAAEALGGVDAVRAAGVLTLEGTGRQYNLGQDMRPGLAGQTFSVSAYRREIDLSGPRLRTTLTRTPNFAYFQGPQAQTQVQGVDGDVAYNGSAAGAATRATRTAAADRRADRYHHPLALLRAALADGATLVAVPDRIGVVADERSVAVHVDGGEFVLAVDAANLPTRVESLSAHPNLGDVMLTTTFAAYTEANGLRLPTRIATKVDGFTTGEYEVTNQVSPAGTVAAPAEAASAAEPAAAPAVNVAVTELAPGVWFLAGQSHHSVVVAFTDRLVMIEAPQSEARSLAAIAAARELRPGTPLTHLVMSHHHFDHSTGLRAAIAEGLTIVTQAGNEAFVQEMAARPFTRMPDALAKAARPVSVEPVTDTHTITDGTRSLVLHHVAGNPHSETMLMAYLPKERLLIEVDAFSPGGTYHPYAANLLGHIERLKLAVDRIVPLHGNVVPLADLVAAARAAS